MNSASYKSAHIRERNKLKRIIQSNGIEFAREWAQRNGVPNMVKEKVNPKIQAYKELYKARKQAKANG